MSNYFIYKNKSITNAEDRKCLREDVFKEKDIIGADFFEIDKNQDSRLFQYLFDSQSDYLYRKKARPSIIIGRKGAGKSTYLNNLAHKRDEIIPVRINNTMLINMAQQSIQKMLANGERVNAERASSIWEHLFYYSILAEWQNRKRNVLVEGVKKAAGSVVSKIGVENLTGLSGEPVSLFYTIVNMSSKLWNKEKNSKNMKDLVDELSRTEGAVKKAIESLRKELKKENKIAMILFDNEEEPPSDHADEATNLAISGLLKQCGAFNEGSGNIQIRYCIPAEQYTRFRKLSKSPGKDFANRHVLYWTSEDLLSMVAHRYLLYLYVMKEEYPEQLTSMYNKLVEFKIHTKRGAQEFFEELLPDTIENDRGIEEKTLPYILRHTQLLPRQVIKLFNKIFHESADENNIVGEINEEHVKGALKNRRSDSEEMDHEIIKAYEHIYPEIEKIRELLSNINLITTCADLRKFYDRGTKSGMFATAKGIMKNVEGIMASPERFLRCLIETGMLGKVIKRREIGGSPGYINVQYEYTMPGDLEVSEEDDLAIHPVFSEKRLKDAGKSYRDNEWGVYPHGTDLEDDWRE